MAVNTRSADGRSIGLILAALAAFGWGAAFYAVSDSVEVRSQKRDAIAALENEKARLASLVEAERTLDQVETEIRKAREDLVATLERRRDLEANLAALHMDVASLGNAASRPQAQSVPDGDETQARAGALNLALVRLDQTIADRSGELAGINRARAEAEDRIQAASEAAEEINTRMGEKAKELSAAERRLSAVLADVSRLEELGERRAAALDAMTARETRAREEVSAARLEIAGLSQRREHLKREVEAIEAALADREAVREVLATEQARLEQLRDEAAAQEASVAESRRQLSRLEAQLESARSEARRLERARPAASEPATEERPDGSRVIRVIPGFN